MGGSLSSDHDYTCLQIHPSAHSSSDFGLTPSTSLLNCTGSQAVMPVPPPLWDALDDSIHSGVFIDTKFVVFSERDKATGRIGQRRTLFANGSVVKSVPALASRFADDAVDLSEEAEPLWLDDYDYDSDSDLDIEDIDEKLPDIPSNHSAQTINPRDSSDSPITTHPTKSNTSVMADSPHITRTILIRDVVFVTFQALLLYLYTGEIRFAPRGGESAIDCSRPNSIQRPSAKSIYRLATKYTIPCLKKLAFAEICNNLGGYSPEEEAFSKLAARYPELRDLFLRSLKSKIQHSKLGASLLREKFEEYAVGKLPHARDAIITLYDMFSGDDPSSLIGLSSSECQSIPMPQLLTDESELPGQDDLKDAITASLGTGIFINYKIYAPVASVQPSDLPSLQPLHFCSFVNPGVLQKVTSELLEPRLNPSSKSSNHTGGVCDQMIQTTRFGDWQSWRSIFLYMYTAEVTFTPLLNPPNVSLQETSCAPKPVYVLSDKVGLLALRNLALCDIKSKMNKGNITEEFFSEFSSEHGEVREMQHRLLQKELRGPETTSGIRQKIFGLSPGQDPHCATAMALVFEGLISAQTIHGSSPSPPVTIRPYLVLNGLPDFVPFNEKDPTNSNLTLTYQNISCMPAYCSWSSEEIRVDHYYRYPKSGSSTSQLSSTTFGTSPLSPSKGSTMGIFDTGAQNQPSGRPHQFL